jgi:hypothetical protein
MERQEWLALRVIEGHLVRSDDLEAAGPLEKLVQRGMRVCKALRVSVAFRGFKAFLVTPGPPVRMENLESKVSPERREIPVLKGSREHPEPPALSASRAIPENEGCQASRDFRAIKVFKA